MNEGLNQCDLVFGFQMFNFFSPKPLRHPLSLLWSGWEGIHFSDDGGQTELAFSCEDLERWPAFSLIGDSLVYISHPQYMVFLSPQGKREIPLSKAIPEKWGVASLFASGGSLFLNLGHKGVVRAVWNVNLENGNVTVLEDVTEIRCAPDSDKVATRNGENFFINNELVQLPPDLKIEVVNWDYDPHENCFCIATAEFLYILSERGWKRVKLSCYLNINNLCINKELKQILVAGNLPFYAYFGGVVRSYDYSGRFRNTVLRAFPFIGTPILIADDNASLLLNRFFNPVK